MAKIKTLISVHASQRVTNNIARVARRLAAICDGYNWVPEENLSITVNFVGEVVDREAAEFCQLVKNAIAPFKPFELSLCGVSAFPDTESPRTLWMGVDEGAPTLVALNRELTKVIQDWGFNKEKNQFLPHMTLGTLRRGGHWNDELLQLLHKLRHHDSGFCTVDKIVVNSSHLERGAPVYTPMATVKLKSGGQH